MFYCLLQNFNNFLSPIILFPPPPPHFFFFYSLFALPSQSWFPSSTILLFSLLLIHLLISLYIFPPTNTSTSYRLYMDPTWTLDSTLCQHSFVNSETIYHHLHHRSIVFLPPPPHLYCFPPPPPINSSEVFFIVLCFYDNMSRLSLGSSCRGNLYAIVGLLARIINWLTVRENDKTSIFFSFSRDRTEKTVL